MLGNFVGHNELNAFGWLIQALVHIQTTNNALGRHLRRPCSTHTQPFRSLRVLQPPIWAWARVIQEFSRLTSALSSGERRHETQSLSRCLTLKRTTLKRTIRGKYERPHCAPHRIRKYTKSSGRPCLSTANTSMPCGLAPSSCELTSIFAIAVKGCFDLDRS